MRSEPEGLSVLEVLRDERNRVEMVRLPSGNRAVLKTFRDAEEYALERGALRHTTSRDPSVSMVRPLEYDDATRTLLLPVAPGRRLDDGWPSARPDDEVTVDLARAMRALWGPPAPDAIPLRTWMRALWRPVPDNPLLTRQRLASAAALADDLLAEPTPAVQLHADLHHENVFRTADGSLTVLDPKNTAGHPAFDCVAQIWNPFGQVTRQCDPAGMLRRRLDVLSEALDLDRAVVLAWVQVGIVLGVAWQFEDVDPDLTGAAETLSIADLLRP